MALGALCIPQMHCRQRNECALSDKIACIQRVVESRASIQYLLEDEDYLGALEVSGCYNNQLVCLLVHSYTLQSHQQSNPSLSLSLIPPLISAPLSHFFSLSLSLVRPLSRVVSQVIHECRTLFAEEGLAGLSCVRSTGRQVTVFDYSTTHSHPC